MDETTNQVDSDEAVNRRTAEIRTEIGQTRANMSETVDAIQARLEPHRVATEVKEKIRQRASEAIDNAKENVKNTAKDRAGQFFSQVGGRVSDAGRRAGTVFQQRGGEAWRYTKDHRVPLALIGAGLGALFLYGSTTRRGSAVRSRYPADRQVNDYDSTMMDPGDVSRHRRGDVSTGLAALGVGALLGYLLPVTRMENECMGEARERFMDQARSFVRQASDRLHPSERHEE